MLYFALCTLCHQFHSTKINILHFTIAKKNTVIKTKIDRKREIQRTSSNCGASAYTLFCCCVQCFRNSSRHQLPRINIAQKYGVSNFIPRLDAIQMLQVSFDVSYSVIYSFMSFIFLPSNLWAKERTKNTYNNTIFGWLD